MFAFVSQSFIAKAFKIVDSRTEQERNTSILVLFFWIFAIEQSRVHVHAYQEEHIQVSILDTDPIQKCRLLISINALSREIVCQD